MKKIIILLFSSLKISHDLVFSACEGQSDFNMVFIIPPSAKHQNIIIQN